MKNTTHKLIDRDDRDEQRRGGQELAMDALDEHDPNYNSQDEYESDFSTTPTPGRVVNNGMSSGSHRDRAEVQCYYPTLLVILA